ncbi:MAG: T9SS type A sorting domain-containing protein [Bacteroidia bacterium]
MKNCLHKIILVTCVITLSLSLKTNAQTCEWRLANPTYSNVDPDGAGLATGSVTFTLQVHTTSGSIPNVTGISTGWSWQSLNAMLPTGSPCGTNSVTQPANITMSTAFAGFTYNNVDECSGSVNFSTGSQTFDRRSSGTVDGGTITLTTTFTDVFTVTLWTLGTSNPEGGYVVINSGSGGSPGAFSTYTISDAAANEYVVNSLTYTTPLALGSGALPVVFTKFEAHCTNSGSVISWATASEFNSNYFQLERSLNGNDWNSIANIKASGTSSSAHNYQQRDIYSGKAFYRIRQVDMDGHYTYTSIISTSCEFNNIGIVLYPVPARDLLNVVIQSGKALKTNLLIIDPVGKIVRKMEVSLINGNNTFQFNLKGLASGEYILNSNAPGIELNKKFNVIR